jgi:DNA-nicking Smr family endonuclease
MTKKYTSLTELAALKKAMEQQTRLEKERAQQALDAKKLLEHQAHIFRNVVQDVKPLPSKHKRVDHATPKPRPLPVQRWSDERDVLKASMSDELNIEQLLDTDDQLSFRRNGIGPDVVKQLRKGKWVIRQQLDLHGLRVDEARLAVAEFIADCMQQDIRCIRIIHGKGLGSAGREPVLRDKVRRWLVQKDEVIAFCQAPPKDGGAGAILVMLRSR